MLCVETILSNLGKRRLVITDLHSHYQMKITTTKELIMLFKTYNDNIQKVMWEFNEMLLLYLGQDTLTHEKKEHIEMYKTLSYCFLRN